MWFRSRGAEALFAGILGSVSLMVATSAAPPTQTDEPFRNQLHAAMMKMDDNMSMPAMGSVDADFVSMMVPHHQGAIEMARIQLRYSHNSQLIRICEEIIVEQQQEIEVMRRAIGQQP
jgi:uncharacterized protein (DUF305 family)